MPFAHMKYDDEYDMECDQERGVTKHTVDRDWGKDEGTRFHCSSCGKKNVNHYLKLANCRDGKYKTAESRKEYAKKNPGMYCYLDGKSKTCAPCLEVKRQNAKAFGRKTKKQLADEKKILRDIILRMDPFYKPENKAEADALGIKWKEEKKEAEAAPAPAPATMPRMRIADGVKVVVYKTQEEARAAQKKVNKKSRGRKKLLIMDDEIEEKPCERCDGDGCGACIDE